MTSKAHDLVYRSKVQVGPLPGRAKRVALPLSPDPVIMGVNGPVAEHYGIAEGRYTACDTTLDYLVASIAACLTGTLAAMLTAAGHPVEDEGLRATAVGDIVVDGGVLRVTRVHVRYDVRPPHDASVRRRVERAHRDHLDRCPTAASVRSAIELTTELEFTSEGAQRTS